MVSTPYGKWEMIRKNPEILSGFSVVRAKKFWTKQQISRQQWYPITHVFWASVAKFLVRAVVSSNYQSRKKVENYIFSTKLRSWQILTGSVARKIAKLGKITSSRVELVCLPRYFVDKLTSLKKLFGLETLVKTRHSFGAKRSC